MSTVSARPEDHERIAAQGFTSRPIQVPMTTLDDILSQAGVAAGIDFITIDVEGLELEVIEGLSIARWKPTIMILEDNSNAMDTSVRDYLAKFGYVRFRRTGVNDWYAHRTDRRLVNSGSRLRVTREIMSLRTKAFLKQFPIIVKLRNALRSAPNGAVK
jgi:hypothetical protein